jgi:hypothetical protein
VNCVAGNISHQIKMRNIATAVWEKWKRKRKRKILGKRRGTDIYHSIVAIASHRTIQLRLPLLVLRREVMSLEVSA